VVTGMHLNLAARSSELTRRIIQVWPVPIEASNAVVERFRLLLAPDEIDRAGRFRFDHLQHAFILARGALRVLLGRYLGIHPASVQFTYGSNGKPGLVGPTHLRFNIAHSGGLAMFAFTLGCEIGVDVEQIRSLPDMQQIANRFFCVEEAAELMSLPAGQREHAFFLCWTRKEAYIKAIGDGLAAPLDGFHVTLQPGEPARFVHLAHDVSAAKLWTLHDLEVASTYAGALAYRDTQRPVDLLPIVEAAELLALP
jgi:4'-phosphopantetheinyl transferase